jgi:hypothetical protein
MNVYYWQQIAMSTRNAAQPVWLFTAWMVVLFLSSGISSQLSGPPKGVHQWRQTDGASMALNYYQNHQAFFSPQEHNLTGTDGHSASEFPIINYLAGRLYYITGPNELIFRLLNGLFMLVGCWYLYKTGLHFIKNAWLALWPVILLTTSPFYFYYGFHFLPNVPAISCALAGWYYFIRYMEQPLGRSISLSMLLFGLAALFKISDGISLIAASGLFLLHFIHRPVAARTGSITGLIAMFLAVAAVGSWTRFTIRYNDIHHTSLSLTGILPIWNMDASSISATCQRFWEEWSKHIFHPVVWVFHAASLLLFLLEFRHLNPLLRKITLLLLAGSLAYILLWMEPMYHHDYYMLTPIITLVFIWLSVLERIQVRIQQVWQTTFYRRSIILLGLACMAGLLWYNRGMQFFRSTDAQYENVAPGFYTIEPYLRSLGIQRTDRVISAGDPTRNVSLYLMNNQGWTDVYNERKVTLEEMLQQGAQYLVVSGTPMKQNAGIQPEQYEQIGAYEGILIYRLK